jgi:hypothetical protein
VAQTILVKNQFIREAAKFCRYENGYIDVWFRHFRFVALVMARQTFIEPSKQMWILHKKLFQIGSTLSHVQPHMMVNVPDAPPKSR